MLTTTALLSHGYLPKYLPPPFTSASWGSKVLAHSIKADKHVETVLLQHRMPRSGSLPRILGVPHPAHFHRLAETVATNWKEIRTICAVSTISLTTPRLGDRSAGERAIEPSVGWRGKPDVALKRRSGRRVMLVADVSQCYPAMYTHAISWAIQGKTAAKAAVKAHGGPTHYADLIDKAVRDAQERQSVGVPIGPDTSAILAEVVLSQVDSILQAGITNLSGVRLIDDYELYFDNVAQAERARELLSRALAEFNMVLNPLKTKVVELPTPLEPKWKHAMADRTFGGRIAVARRRIRAAADAAFEQHKSDRESRAISYLLAMLAGCTFTPDAWPLVQDIALASLEFEEGSLSRAGKLFLKAKSKGWTLDSSRIGVALNRIILRHAPLRYGNSVAWAIWLLLMMEIHVAPEACDAAGQMDDALVLTVLGHAKSLGFATRTRLNSLAKARLTPITWSSSDWIFLYECVQHGWLGPTTAKTVESVLKKAPYLSALNKRGVSFYDVGAGTVAIGSEKPAEPEMFDVHAWGVIDVGSY